MVGLIWTTRDGTKIPYSKLTVKHIYNIINYAKKHGFVESVVSTSLVDNTDNVITTYDCSNQVISEMEQELKRRNICPN